MDLLPQLSSLFDLSALPPELSFLDKVTTDALKGVFYKNYNVSRGLGPGTASFDIELVSYKVLRLGLPGTDFALSINEQDFAPKPGQPATPLTVIPVSGSYRWGILQYLPAYDITQDPLSAAADFLDLAEQLLGSSPQIQFSAVFEAFVEQPVDPNVNPSRVPQLQTFAATLRAQYPSLVLASPLAGTTEDAAAQEILDALAAANVEVLDVARKLFILAPGMSAADSLAALDKYFKAVTGFNFRAYVLSLLVPEVSVATQLSAAIEFPRSLLQPVYFDATTQKYLVAADPAKAKFIFGTAQFTFSTQGGFGYETELEVNFPADQKRVQVGNSGLQVYFKKAKLDLSTKQNIAEADADGRPSTFQGLYVQQADVYLPADWDVQVGSLGVKDLLVGTGGVSGTFTAQPRTAGGPLLQANLFGDVAVAFTSFNVVFSQNSVVSSDVTGTFSLASFKDDKGQVVQFPFDLGFSAAGYELALKAPVDAKGRTVPVVVKLAGLAELHVTRLAFGKDVDGIYLDLVADLVVTQALPIVGRAMPSKIAISKLRVDTDQGITVAAKPVWADGTTTSKSLEKGGSITQAMSLTIAKVLRVNNVHLDLPYPSSTGTLTATATFDATLGLTDDSTASEPDADGTPPPGFRASVSNAGFRATLTRVPKDPITGASTGTGTTPVHGNLGLLDVGLALKLPDGASVSINAGGLVGAGKLSIFDNGTRYEGALALTFRDTLHLTAYALLNERLPDGSPGPSLLALVTAQFEPVQLGLGFTLKGVGGLLGLHRSANTDYLRSLVRGGQMDKLLFPDNVLDNLTSVLTTINGAFPAAKGRYVIGLLAQLGWGTPELISLDVALLVELPAPVRLLILGVLRAMLPSRQNDILSLRADFLGSVDFGAKKVSFDASLVDSRLWKFTLSGDIAFRLFQGDNPVFVITAGGFHPNYQPPAGADLTGLKRITLALAKNDNLRLTLESYFAVTSNTVQFGAHLALYYAIARGLHVEGNFSFDALFQLNPFHVEVGVEAGVAIKYGSSELLSLHLSLHVTGPGPWHVWGEASFRVWFVKISVDVNASIGERPDDEPTLQRPDVYTPLKAALLDGANWLVEAPANALPSSVVLRPASAAAGQVFLDPRGAITLRQRVTPLGVKLEKFGSNPLTPIGGNYFEVPSFKVGPDSYSPATLPGIVEETKDFFAPSQYYKLSDGEKLSRPSFESLTNGLRITSLATLVGADTATRRVVEYEQLLLDSTAAGGFVAGGADTARFTPDAFGKLAKGSVLGQAIQAAQPSQRAPAPVSWAADTYEVVRAATLAIYDPADTATQYAGHEKFGSQLEADQYCQAVMADHATLAGELLVVPTYQLELA